MTIMIGMPDFSTKLNQLLNSRGLTQADLREAIGKTVSNGTVSHWCSGKSLPRLDEAFKIASVLGVSISFLADDSRDSPIEPGSQIDPQDAEVLMIARRLGHERAMRRLLSIPSMEDIKTTGLN